MSKHVYSKTVLPLQPQINKLNYVLHEPLRPKKTKTCRKKSLLHPQKPAIISNCITVTARAVRRLCRNCVMYTGQYRRPPLPPPQIDIDFSINIAFYTGFLFFSISPIFPSFSPPGCFFFYCFYFSITASHQFRSTHPSTCTGALTQILKHPIRVESEVGWCHNVSTYATTRNYASKGGSFLFSFNPLSPTSSWQFRGVVCLLSSFPLGLT